MKKDEKSRGKGEIISGINQLVWYEISRKLWPVGVLQRTSILVWRRLFWTFYFLFSIFYLLVFWGGRHHILLGVDFLLFSRKSTPSRMLCVDGTLLLVFCFFGVFLFFARRDRQARPPFPPPPFYIFNGRRFLLFPFLFLFYFLFFPGRREWRTRRRRRRNAQQPVTLLAVP